MKMMATFGLAVMVAPLLGSQTHSGGEMIRQDHPRIDVIYESRLG